MLFAVIIPTVDGKKLLQKSIPLLLTALGNIKSSEIIVVDNGSIDGTIEKLNELEYRLSNLESSIKLKTIVNKKNLGFARAVNQGARKAKGKYLLILNNDCFVEKDTITRMIDFLERNKELVATQPITYRTQHIAHNTRRRKIESIGYVVDTWFGRARTIVSKSDILNSRVKILNSRFIYGLSATCLLIKKDVFVNIGMFDESFHSYLEDVDLFIRLHNKGYKYKPTLSAKCFHEHMATSSKMGIYKEVQDFKNWIRIIFKNFSLLFILSHSPTLFIERLRNLSGIVKKLVKC